jgi:hypothetical protein
MNLHERYLQNAASHTSYESWLNEEISASEDVLKDLEVPDLDKAEYRSLLRECKKEIAKLKHQ